MDTATLLKVGGVPTHENLNDPDAGRLQPQGSADLLGAVYHPEASPGPHDAIYLFDCFADMMNTGRAPTAEHMAAAQARLEGKPA